MDRRLFRSRAAGPVALALLCLAFYWRLIASDDYTWLDSPDIAYMEIPRFQFQASEWHHMRAPLWDPYLWSGQPLLGQVAGAAYPLNWPLFLAGFSGGKIRQDFLDWYFVWIHWLAALFCYAFARDQGTSRGAAIAAGAIFSFGGYLGTSDWPQVLNGCVWVPLAFLYLLRAVEGRRPAASAALSGAVIGISWLSGHHQAPYYLTVAALLTWIAFAASRRSLALARHALLALLVTALTGGLQLVPAYEYGRLALRWVSMPDPVAWNQKVPLYVHEYFAMTPADLPGLVLPGFSGHTSPYIGVAALVFAAIAVTACWTQRPLVPVMAALAGGSLLLAMARLGFLYPLAHTLVPLWEKSRVPARLVMLFSFAAAVLAAVGFDWARSHPGARALRIGRNTALAAAAAMLLLAAGMRTLRQDAAIETMATTAMFALVFAGLAAAWSRFPSAAGAAMVALILLELAMTRPFTNRRADNYHSLWAGLWAHDDLAAFLHSKPKPFRAAVDDKAIPYNFGDWHRIETTAGYLAGVTANQALSAAHTARMQDLLGARYTLANAPSRPGQVDLYQGISGVHVYENAEAFPRAWIVHEVERIPDAARLRARVQDPAVDLRRTALVEDELPRLTACPGEEPIEWLEQGAGRVVLDVTVRCAGLLVVSDTWFPGWKAAVDGRERVIYQVDGVLRGVVVGPGRHRVEFRYRPASGFIGAGMTAAGLLLAAVLARRNASPAAAAKPA